MSNNKVTATGWTIKKRCNKCMKVMRNDGTEENPKWVCNNPKCVRYVPPKGEE